VIVEHRDASIWRLEARVRGRVQGVFFRESTRQRAQELGLAGWVRNAADGSVECLFIGPRDACERALDFVRVGPPAASVTDVDVKWTPTADSASGSFEVRR
jgi:acylphosphatase